MKRTVYPRKKQRALPTPSYEEAFRKSQQALRQFVQTVPVAVCILDRAERIYLEANKSFTDMVGLTRNQVLYQRDVKTPIGLGELNVNKILSRIDREESVQDLDLYIYTRAGKLIKGKIRAERVDYSGRPCVLVTFTQAARGEMRLRPPAHESKLAAAGEVGKALSEMIDLQEIYRRLAGGVLQLLPEVCTVYISLYDTRRKKIKCGYAEHEGEALDVSGIPEINVEGNASSLQAQVVRSAQPAIVHQFSQFKSEHKFTPHKPAESGMYVPMLAKGTVIGLVQAYSYRPGRFHKNDAALLGLIVNTAAIAIQNAQLAQNLERTNLDLTQTYEATIDGWTRALELRDFTTERHTQRVVTLTLELGKRLGLEGHDLVRVRRGAQLHDIGKMGIPDNILLKAGPLDETEWRVMRRHPVYAYELLRPIPHFSEIIEIPYCHHEKWDGSGYPRRLRGEEIPLSARIFSIVDVWDALSSNRPYRTAWPVHQVIDYISFQANKHFEPEVTKAFLDLVRGGGTPPPARALSAAGNGKRI
jgi:PAS domain S-box-containing protein